MAMQSPREFLVYDLSMIHSGEQSLSQILSQMEQVCQDPQLKQLIGNHISTTQQQASRLQECFRLMGEQPMNVTNQTVACMQQDMQSFMQESPSAQLVDMFCAGAVSKSEHYEIACYTNLVNNARMMGQPQIASILQETLQEEQSTAQQVEKLATQIGSQAVQRMGP